MGQHVDILLTYFESVTCWQYLVQVALKLNGKKKWQLSSQMYKYSENHLALTHNSLAVM